MRKLMVAAAIAALALAGGAQAQQQAAIGGLVCTGKAVSVRFVAIKPGQAALYAKAVADHQAWYATHHNKTVVASVQVASYKGGKAAFDSSSAVSIVTYDTASQPAHDAAYDAFVKEYKDSSSITEERRGCMK